MEGTLSPATVKLLQLSHEADFQSNETLNDLSYRKVVLRANGEVFAVTCPAFLIIGSGGKHWHLGRGLCLGYGKDKILNEYWEKLREHVPRAPKLYGDLVLWRYGVVMWNADLCFAELLNFLRWRYHQKASYHFTDFAREV